MESALKHDDFIVLALTGDVYSSGKQKTKKQKKKQYVHVAHRGTRVHRERPITDKIPSSINTTALSIPS